MIHARILALLVATLLWNAEPVRASDWMFQQSYFSRGVPAETRAHIPQLNGRAAYRRPFVHLNAGGAIRGGYRINRFQIRSGIGFDTTIIRENWHQLQPAP